MERVKQINVRTLLRNFSDLRHDIVNTPNVTYHIVLDKNNTIELKKLKTKKSNVTQILEAAKQLPKDLQVKRVRLSDSELLPKRVW